MAKAYSLWITPTDEAESKLNSIVIELSKNYHGPVFEPHMTLLGPIFEDKGEVVRKAKLLARQTAPFQLFLGEIDFSTTYFQCVFVRIQTNIPLLNARAKAQQMFDDKTFFMPHISLYYGNDNIEQREKIVKSIAKLAQLSFVASKIAITPATEDPGEWEHIAEIPFED